MTRQPPACTLFPYTTLFRSRRGLGQRLLLEHRRGRRRGRLPELHRHRLGRIALEAHAEEDRKSTRLNSSHTVISYAVFCLKKKKTINSACVNDQAASRV